MGRLKTTINDFQDQDTLLKGVSALTEMFANWEAHDGQGTRQLWSMLGKVYELGDQIDRNALVKTALIEQVSNDANVQASNKWRPDKKGAHELLLVRLLSLKQETKAKKSQWLSAIRAAAKAKTPPSESEFVSFLAAAGGIDGARKRQMKVPKPKLTYEELVQRALDWVPEGADPTDKITIPKFFEQTLDLPGEVGLVLVHGEKAGAKAIRLATIADEKLIARCIEFLIKSEEALAAEIESRYAADTRSILAQMNEAKKRLRTQYAKDKKAYRGPYHYPTFSEYVDEKFDEDERLSQLKSRHSVEYERFKMRFSKP